MENASSMNNMINKNTSISLLSILESSSNTNLISMKSNVEKAIENKFYCPSKFCQEIEKIVLDNEEMNYIDAVLFFCEKNNIEIESISKLITKPLKEKIKCNAIELNFMKKSSRAKLPI